MAPDNDSPIVDLTTRQESEDIIQMLIILAQQDPDNQKKIVQWVSEAK